LTLRHFKLLTGYFYDCVHDFKELLVINYFF
jgi:hypothetical protein